MSGDVREVRPWAKLARLPHWKLAWHNGGDLGITDHEACVISLRRDLSWAERRCTILHECLHAERGPAPAALAGREELRVRRLTARMLLPRVQPIGEALAWSDLRVAEAAVELDVDTGVLWDRLDHLHHLEERYLRLRLEDL